MVWVFRKSFPLPAKYLASYNKAQLDYDMKKVKFHSNFSREDLMLHSRTNCDEAKTLHTDSKSDLIFKIVFGQFF